MTRRLGFLAIAALAAACGGDGGNDEKAPPEVPVFAGLDAVEVVPGETSVVELRWTRGTDDKTPPERLRYELEVRRDLAGPNSVPQKYDVSDSDGTFRWANLVDGNVHWFSVTVSDEDGNEAGGDRVLPAVSPSQPPRISGLAPARIEAGQQVSVTGEYFLDEQMLPDALTIGGQVVTPIVWSSHQIWFEVPRTLVGEGRVSVATPFGRVEAPTVLLIDPPGPVGQN